MNPLILMVNDEPDVEPLFRQNFRRDLRSGRFRMDFARSGAPALKSIGNASDASPILILSDIKMPGMTGLELLPPARAMRPNAPMIMVTAYGNSDTTQKARDGGSDSLIAKPIDFAALRSEIEQPLEPVP